MENNITEQEKLFCELYVNGEAPFAGDAAKCYQEVFNDLTNKAKAHAMRLLAREDIQEYLKKLDELPYEDAKYMKVFLRENLINIVKECSTANYRDRKGTLLSPAALRSVAVSASKALMDLYPVKEAQLNKLSIDGSGDGGIVFNVIIPEQSKVVDKGE